MSGDHTAQCATATARHQIANLLHTYTDIADRKDIAAAVRLLGTARVRFPCGGFDESGQAFRLLRTALGVAARAPPAT